MNKQGMFQAITEKRSNLPQFRVCPNLNQPYLNTHLLYAPTFIGTWTRLCYGGLVYPNLTWAQLYQHLSEQRGERWASMKSRWPGGCRIAKESVEQLKGRRAARKVKNSHQGTEFTRERRGIINVPVAYQPGGHRVPRIAPKAKRAPSVRGRARATMKAPRNQERDYE